MFALLLVALALIRFVAWPQLDRFKPQLLASAEGILGQPVQVAGIETTWQGLRGPEVRLDGVRVGADGAEPKLIAQRVVARLGWRSLLSASAQFDELSADGLELRIERTGEGQYAIAGLPFDLNKPDDPNTERRALRWLVDQRAIVLNHATVIYNDVQQGLAPLKLTGLLQIENRGRGHSITVRSGGLDSETGRNLTGDVEFDGYFVHGLEFSPTDLLRWDGQASIRLAQVDAGALAARLPMGDLPAPLVKNWPSGVGDFKLTAALAQARVQSVGVEIGATDLVWPGAPQAQISDIQIRAESKLTADGYVLNAQNLTMNTADGLGLQLLEPARLELDLQGVPRSARAKIKSVNLRALNAFAHHLPIDSDTRAKLPSGKEINGELNDVDLDWQADERLAMTASFNKLAIAAVPADKPNRPGRPGTAGLSGQLNLSRDAGRVVLKQGPTSLSFPGVFADQHVPVKEIDGTISWRFEPNPAGEGGRQIVAETSGLKLITADGEIELTGSYRSGGRGPGLIDLTGRARNVQLPRVARYLPVQLPVGVRDWVARAVRAGKGESAEFRVNGDIFDFPFREAQSGEFKLSTKVRDGTLQFANDWPAIEDIDGTLTLERNSMLFTAEGAKTLGAKLGPTRAQIADFANAVVVVDGKAAGPAADLLRYVNQSPIHAMINDFTAESQATGEAQVDLKLNLPLAKLADARIDGTVKFNGNRIVLDKTMPRFDDVTGALEITDRGFAMRDLQAKFLGGPLSVSAESAAPGKVQIRADGRANVEGLRGLIDSPLLGQLSGETKYRATIMVDRRGTALKVESDLTGLASALPAPFAKAARDALALKIETVPEPAKTNAAQTASADTDQIKLSLGSNIRAAFERKRGPGDAKFRIRRGAFTIGGEPVLPAGGFAVTANVNTIDLDQWQKLLSADSPAPAKSAASAAGAGDAFRDGFSLVPTQLSVLAKQARVFNKDFHEVVLGATQTGGNWRTNISSREIGGFVNWKAPADGKTTGTLQARFKRLEIPASRANEAEPELDQAQRQLPALDIIADDLVIGGKSLGTLMLTASNSGDADNAVWKIDALSLKNSAAAFKAVGAWSRRPATDKARAGTATAMNFELDIEDTGALLERFGMKGAVKGGAGKLSGEIDWRAAPYALDYDSLVGKLRLDLGSGQFLKVDPGVAKLISVVNLQSLPHRLSLDFRDVFSGGFLFDKIEGDVEVDQGVATTHNFLMKGVQAQVNISGTADIANETQQLSVKVVPELNAGLASLAYAALANPAIGIGSFLAQMALRKPLQEMFAYEVEVTGSWVNPTVTPHKRPEVVVRKDVLQAP